MYSFIHIFIYLSINLLIYTRADYAVKKRIQLENDNSHKEENIDKLENQLKEDKFTLSESERKYDDIARKLATKVFTRICISPAEPS